MSNIEGNSSIPKRISFAKAKWSLSLAIATTTVNRASGNANVTVSDKAFADSLVWADKYFHKEEQIRNSGRRTMAREICEQTFGIGHLT